MEFSEEKTLGQRLLEEIEKKPERPEKQEKNPDFGEIKTEQETEKIIRFPEGRKVYDRLIKMTAGLKKKDEPNFYQRTYYPLDGVYQGFSPEKLSSEFNKYHIDLIIEEPDSERERFDTDDEDELEKYADCKSIWKDGKEDFIEPTLVIKESVYKVAKSMIDGRELHLSCPGESPCIIFFPDGTIRVDKGSYDNESEADAIQLFKKFLPEGFIIQSIKYPSGWSELIINKGKECYPLFSENAFFMEDQIERSYAEILIGDPSFKNYRKTDDEGHIIESVAQVMDLPSDHKKNRKNKNEAWDGITKIVVYKNGKEIEIPEEYHTDIPLYLEKIKKENRDKER